MLVKLENEMWLHTYNSDNRPFEENCDSVLGFCLFNKDYSYEDGGEFDFNSKELLNDEDLLKALIQWYFEKDLDYTFVANTCDCCYEDFNELLEDNDIEL